MDKGLVYTLKAPMDFPYGPSHLFCRRLQGEVKTKNRKTVSAILFPCQDFKDKNDR